MLSLVCLKILNIDDNKPHSITMVTGRPMIHEESTASLIQGLDGTKINLRRISRLQPLEHRGTLRSATMQLNSYRRGNLLPKETAGAGIGRVIHG